MTSKEQLEKRLAKVEEHVYSNNNDSKGKEVGYLKNKIRKLNQRFEDISSKVDAVQATTNRLDSDQDKMEELRKNMEQLQELQSSIEDDAEVYEKKRDEIMDAIDTTNQSMEELSDWVMDCMEEAGANITVTRSMATVGVKMSHRLIHEDVYTRCYESVFEGVSESVESHDHSEVPELAHSLSDLVCNKSVFEGVSESVESHDHSEVPELAHSLSDLVCNTLFLCMEGDTKVRKNQSYQEAFLIKQLYPMEKLLLEIGDKADMEQIEQVWKADDSQVSDEQLEKGVVKIFEDALSRPQRKRLVKKIYEKTAEGQQAFKDWVEELESQSKEHDKIREFIKAKENGEIEINDETELELTDKAKELFQEEEQ